MSFASLLNTTMDVYNRTVTADAVGGRVYANGDIAITAWPCRIEQLNESDIEHFGRLGFDATHRIFCEPNDAIAILTSKFVIGTTEYDTVAIHPAQGASDTHHLEILVKEKV